MESGCYVCQGDYTCSDCRRLLVGESVDFTDGRKGVIAGRLLPFASVVSFDGMIRHEYTWSTVQRYVESGKAFPVS